MLTDGDSGHHDTDLRQAPTEDEGDDRKMVLERGAEDDHTADEDRQCEVTHPQARFGLEDAVVAPNALLGDEVVHIAANKLSENDCNL